MPTSSGVQETLGRPSIIKASAVTGIEASRSCHGRSPNGVAVHVWPRACTAVPALPIAASNKSP